jgi:uncharacterized protein YdhG (YjbR/CyaY superfamily)
MKKGGAVMKITTVDEFIKHKVQPEHREIVAMLRKSMRETAPKAKEVISYGILAWRGNLILAVVSPTKKDITLAFSKGAEFEDKYSLLQGVGRVSKHVKIKNLKEVDKTALKYYIKQALKLDAR